VYAHHKPPTTGPSYLDELKAREIDATDSATRYDIATAGWEPDPRYSAFQDNIGIHAIDACRTCLGRVRFPHHPANGFGDDL
jgi:hypothetical protein